MEVIAAVGFIATFLGICIAVSAYFNGKHIKAGVSEIAKMIDGIKAILHEMQKQGEERHKEVMETAEQRHKEVMETAEQRHREVMELAERRHKEIIELAEQRHKEVLQLIASIKGS
jgi:predicted transcriptional regulator